MMEDGKQPPGLEKRFYEEEDGIAGLFKPNPQTHEQRLADPWTITNSITGEGTSWYKPPPGKDTTTANDAGEKIRITHESIEKQEPVEQQPRAEKCHYTAPPHQIPFFVSPPGVGPVNTPAEQFFADTEGYVPPKVLFGVPREIFADPGYGTPYAAYPPPTPAANRLRKRLGSKADWQFPAAEQEMRSGSPPSGASIEDPPMESGQQEAGSAPEISPPAAAVEGASPRSEASAKSVGSGKWTGLGHGLWPLGGVVSSGGSPPTSPSPRPHLRASARLASLADGEAALEKEKRDHAWLWSNSRRQILHQYLVMHEKLDQFHVREVHIAQREAAIFHSHCAVQQRLAELDFERAAVIRRSAEKDQKVTAIREQCERYKERIIALQNQVKTLQQQKVQVMLKASSQLESKTAVPAPAAQPLQQAYQQQGVGAGGFVQHPAHRPMQQPQGPFNHAPGQHFPAASQLTVYPGHQFQYQHCRNYVPPPIYYSGETQGIISGPPTERLYSEFIHPPPRSPTPAPPTTNFMAAWDNNAVHNMNQEPGSFFSHAGSSFSSGSTKVDDSAPSTLDSEPTTTLDSMHQARDSLFSNAPSSFSSASTLVNDDVPYTVDNEQSPPRTASRIRGDDTQIRQISTSDDRPIMAPWPVIFYKPVTAFKVADTSNLRSHPALQCRIEHVNSGYVSSPNTRASINLVPHPTDDVFMPLTQSPIRPQQDRLQEQDYHSKTYTNLLNACFSKVEAAVRNMDLVSIVRQAKIGDRDAQDFIKLCQMHLGSDLDTWFMLQERNMKQHLVVGAVQQCVAKYTILHGILTEFECQYQRQFIGYYGQEKQEEEEEGLDSIPEGRYHTAQQRAALATAMARLPQFSDWLRLYTEKTIDRIIHDIKPAFTSIRMPVFKAALWFPVHEALSVGVRMLQDPRSFGVVFPKLGSAWDGHHHVHRNPELVGQRVESGVVACTLRPLVMVRSFAEDDLPVLVVHRAEVIIR